MARGYTCKGIVRRLADMTNPISRMSEILSPLAAVFFAFLLHFDGSLEEPKTGGISSIILEGARPNQDNSKAQLKEQMVQQFIYLKRMV